MTLDDSATIGSVALEARLRSDNRKRRSLRLEFLPLREYGDTCEFASGVSSAPAVILVPISGVPTVDNDMLDWMSVDHFKKKIVAKTYPLEVIVMRERRIGCRFFCASLM